MTANPWHSLACSYITPISASMVTWYSLTRKRNQIKLPAFIGSQRKQMNSRGKTYFCFIVYAKAFDCVNHNKLWTILKKIGIPDHLAYILRNVSAGQEARVRIGHGTVDWFRIVNRVHQGCNCHPARNLLAECTSCEMLGWMNYKLESRLPGEISIISDKQMRQIPPLWQKVKKN